MQAAVGVRVSLPRELAAQVVAARVELLVVELGQALQEPLIVVVVGVVAMHLLLKQPQVEMAAPAWLFFLSQHQRIQGLLQVRRLFQPVGQAQY